MIDSTQEAQVATLNLLQNLDDDTILRAVAVAAVESLRASAPRTPVEQYRAVIEAVVDILAARSGTEIAGTEFAKPDDLLIRIDEALSLKQPRPWSAAALDAALRYYRKNDLGVDEEPGTYAPHDYDAKKIAVMPELLALAASRLRSQGYHEIQAEPKDKTHDTQTCRYCTDALIGTEYCREIRARASASRTPEESRPRRCGICGAALTAEGEHDGACKGGRALGETAERETNGG